MEQENRIKMTETKDPKEVAQQVTQQAGDAVPESASSEGGESSIQQKVQEAMAQGQESGLLNADQLQDGSVQDKVKEAMEKGQAPGGFLSSAFFPFASIFVHAWLTQTDVRIHGWGGQQPPLLLRQQLRQCHRR